MTEWKQFANWVFYALISGIAVYGVSILDRLETSINSLNVNVAVLIDKNDRQEKLNDRFERDIEELKERSKR